MIVKYVPSAISLTAAFVARLASSNLPCGDFIDVEQSMMIASTRSGGLSTTISLPTRDADDGIDRPGSFGEIGIVVDVDSNTRDALLLSRTHEDPPIGITATVMLSWPPALNA